MLPDLLQLVCSFIEPKSNIRNETDAIYLVLETHRDECIRKKEILDMISEFYLFQVRNMVANTSLVVHARSKVSMIRQLYDCEIYEIEELYSVFLRMFSSYHF